MKAYKDEIAVMKYLHQHNLKMLDDLMQQCDINEGAIHHMENDLEWIEWTEYGYILSRTGTIELEAVLKDERIAAIESENHDLRNIREGLDAIIARSGERVIALEAQVAALTAERDALRALVSEAAPKPDDDFHAGGHCHTCARDLGYGECADCLREQGNIANDQRYY